MAVEASILQKSVWELENNQKSNLILQPKDGDTQMGREGGGNLSSQLLAFGSWFIWIIEGADRPVYGSLYGHMPPVLFWLKQHKYILLRLVLWLTSSCDLYKRLQFLWKNRMFWCFVLVFLRFEVILVVSFIIFIF